MLDLSEAFGNYTTPSDPFERDFSYSASSMQQQRERATGATGNSGSVQPTYQPPVTTPPQTCGCHQCRSGYLPRGEMFKTEEFCNLILFVTFGAFSLFVIDSLIKIATK